MRNRLKLAAAFVAAALSSGCVKVVVNEDRVFAPVPFDRQRAAESGEVILGEAAFSNRRAWKDAWGWQVQHGYLTGEAPEFAPIEKTHGRLKTPSGRIAWTLLNRDDDGRPLIVRCGGNTTTRQNNGYAYGVTAITEGDVLLFDYPGSGESGGKATSEQFNEMVDALAGLVAEKAAGRRVVLWGHSLGGFVCAELASRLPSADGVILEGTARNAREVADALTPWIMAPFVKVDVAESLKGYDNVEALRGFNGPILVLGARRDRTLPVKLSRNIASALRRQGGHVRYVEFRHGEHGNFGAQPEFRKTISDFFARLPSRA
jgi:pimeloyl-ACP methyl ester carboxylesterase